jgi:small subunit ribosomal protein S20
LRIGLAVIWAEPLLRPLFLMGVTQPFFGAFYSTLYAFYTIKVLHLSTTLIGITVGVGGIGSMLGAVMAAPMVRLFGVGRAILLGFLISSLSAFFVPLAHGEPLQAVAFLMLAQLFGDSFAGGGDHHGDQPAAIHSAAGSDGPGSRGFPGGGWSAGHCRRSRRRPDRWPVRCSGSVVRCGNGDCPCPGMGPFFPLVASQGDAGCTSARQRLNTPPSNGTRTTMPNIASAKKRVRTTAKRTAINQSRKTRVRGFIRKVEEAIASGDSAKAQAALKAAEPEIMRGVSKGVIHKNTGSRKVSRLSKRVASVGKK